MQKVLLSVVILFFLIPLTACSVAIPLPALFTSDATGSIAPKPNADSKPLVLVAASGGAKIADTSTFGSAFDKSDWLAAKPALSEALMSTREDTTAVPWFDPQTGASGQFTRTLEKTGTLAEGCRSFVARIDAYEGTHSVPGKACPAQGGVWKVEEVLPDSFN